MTQNSRKITGIILAGGRSKRLDYRNKALLPIGNKSIIEIVIDAVSKVTEKIILITNSPDEYGHLGLLMLGDIFAESGPIGGIYTGLRNSETYQNFVIACDMPFIQPQILELLIRQSEGYDIVIPVTPDGYQPLCAIYSKSCIKPIESLVEAHRLKVTNLFQYARVKKIVFDDQNPFLNVNTEEDYLKAIHTIEAIGVSVSF